MRRSVARAANGIVAVTFVARVLRPEDALAHGAERGFVLLMPSGFAMVGGAAAVAATFVAVALLPRGFVRGLFRARVVLCAAPHLSTTLISTASFAVLACLLAIGAVGIRDPLENPLPLAIWTFGWVLLPLLIVLFGPLWRGLNPFVGPYRLVDWLLGGRLSASARPPPDRLGYLPAVAFFLVFAWIELVFPAPEDPPTLARLVFAWLAITFTQMIVFGERWLEKGEALSVIYRLLADLAPLQLDDGPDGRRLVLSCPGAALIERPPLPPSGVVFVLLTLATVSFDGISKTFAFLGLVGVNPLEYPGRTAMMGAATMGLFATVAVLTALFMAAVGIGVMLARVPVSVRAIAGGVVMSILPISIAFHFAHYLTALLINGQFALVAFGDPLGRGWQPFGFSSHEVAAGFMATASGAAAIWTIQTLVVVIGHVLAVVIAHATILEIAPARRSAAVIEAPLAFMMVGYTAFGLWVLSTPVVA